ncbi:MAG: hypothetical protein IKG69_06050 [Atopobiaceae bacterium]|nr:hypothetical protein [Atopobiaceae bacterium]
MADATFEMEFFTEGFQQILNSGGTKALLHSCASQAVGRMGGLGYERSAVGGSGPFGPRPIATVFAHKYPDPVRQMIANRRLEGAM